MKNSRKHTPQVDIQKRKQYEGDQIYFWITL